MKKILMASVSALALAAVASPAVAGSGYVAAGVGFATGWDERDWERRPPPGAAVFSSGSQRFDTGTVFEGAVGYNTGQLEDSVVGLRIELQGTHINYPAEDVTFFPSSSDPEGGRTGDLTETLWMANVLVDFHLSRLQGITPYVGVGLGVARGVMNTIIDGSGPPFVTFDEESDSDFVWQFILGASAEVVDRLELYGNYRVIQLPELVLNDQGARGGPVTFDDETTHLFTIGLRVNF